MFELSDKNCSLHVINYNRKKSPTIKLLEIKFQPESYAKDFSAARGVKVPKEENLEIWVLLACLSTMPIPFMRLRKGMFDPNIGQIIDSCNTSCTI